MCSEPFRPGGSIEWPCGKCPACRLNRAKLWQGRLLLERLEHRDGLFVTLTYDDDNVPHVQADNGQSWRRDGQLFMKRLRRFHPSPVRYFLVGEYGSLFARPHFHVCLFGTFDVSLDRQGFIRSESIDKAWKYGHVKIGEVTPESAAYVTGYVLKGWTSGDDVQRDGLPPEFCRMSLRPGIGALCLPGWADRLMTRVGAAGLAQEGDVITQFRMGAQWYPLGKYLSRKFREELGRDGKAPVFRQLEASARVIAEPREARESRRKAQAAIAEQRHSGRLKKRKL